MELIGILLVVTVVTCGFLQELKPKKKKKEKPNAEEALGKALIEYLASGMKGKAASKE